MNNEDYQRGYRDGLKRAAEIAGEYEERAWALFTVTASEHQEGKTDGAGEVANIIRREMRKMKKEGKADA